MKIVIFGLSISSSWGNGHATIWRAIVKELVKRKHQVTFFEKDYPYYQGNRDFTGIQGLDLIVYESWSEIEYVASTILTTTDVAIVSSFCSDAVKANYLINTREVPLSIFYDLDTPVTLNKIDEGVYPEYIDKREKLSNYDLVLSFTGGRILEIVKERLNAPYVFPLYGCVDYEIHHPVRSRSDYVCDLSYLGTYADDRQEKLNDYMILPAKHRPENKFIIAGAQYPDDFPWKENIFFISHLSANMHSCLYSSSKFTLNITRMAMSQVGYCPSGRLFEAAASGVTIISDDWEGIEDFFIPDEEIVIIKNSEDMLRTLELSKEDRHIIALNAYRKVLNNHTAKHRVSEFEKIIREF
jgi:spore maturation protein CgeB